MSAAEELAAHLAPHCSSPFLSQHRRPAAPASVFAYLTATGQLLLAACPYPLCGQLACWQTVQLAAHISPACLRPPPPACRGPAGLEALDLQLLGAAHAAGTGAAGAADDFDCDTTSGVTGSISKRAKQTSGAWEAGSPSASGRGVVGAGTSGGGGGLMLSMDYERAAESINLELLAAGRK